MQNTHFAGNSQTSLFHIQLLLTIPVEATEMGLWMQATKVSTKLLSTPLSQSCAQAKELGELGAVSSALRGCSHFPYSALLMHLTQQGSSPL